ncbi:MAG: CRISPR-associated endonuclease Cas2 [bacterium]|nr:CRISPR-associated endonuclease Cas2 [bacterium]
MKLPITDAFLWKLYNCIIEIEKTYDLISPPRSFFQILYPDTVRLRREYERQKAKTDFSKFIHYLQQKGYIRVKALEGTKGIILTPKGAERVLCVKRKLTKKRRRKDGKWIMVIFDIPEKRKPARELLRDALIALGYQMFQQSVWICPYDVYAETEEAVREYRVIPYVKLFLIEELM